MRFNKFAGLRYSDTPYGTSNEPPPQRGIIFSDQKRKAQKNNPLETSNVPFEDKHRLLKRNSKSLGRSMERAGGPTTQEGSVFASVLRERGINQNLAGQKSTFNLSKAIPSTLFKAAMLNAFDDEMLKLAEESEDDSAIAKAVSVAPAAIAAGLIPIVGYGIYKSPAFLKRMKENAPIHGRNALARATGDRAMIRSYDKPNKGKPMSMAVPAGIAAAGTYLGYDAVSANKSKKDSADEGL
jgi:hypothetical protein